MYYALYRKWRPKVFENIVGQEHIVKTLKNQVRDNKVAHAYLFTGFKGTGKTSCARILAKAVNCLNLQNGDPCNECSNCKGIDNGSILDILEIDAASNNGVENIRGLREEAFFTPSVAKYRIYIIDEAHMLSIGAFNALLKIIEEPPKYVMFILATTDIHKIPATILSRCQQFRFNKINDQDIQNRIMFISQEEKIILQEDAAKMITKLSDGGMRDALSILDSCISYSSDNLVDMDIVSQVVSMPENEDILSITKNIIDKDIAKVIDLINKLVRKTIDPYRLSQCLITYFRDIMMFKISGSTSNLEADAKSIQELKNHIDKITLSRIFNIINILSDYLNRMTKTTFTQIELEVAMIKIIVDEDNPIKESSITNGINSVLNSILDKLQKLENKVNELEKIHINKNKIVKLPDETKDKDSFYANELQVYSANKDIPEVENWSNILEVLTKLNPALNAALKDSKGYIDESLGIIFIHSDSEFFLELIRSSVQAKQTLKDAISQVLGKKYKIGPYKKPKKNTNSLIDNIEKLAKENGIDTQVY